MSATVTTTTTPLTGTWTVDPSHSNVEFSVKHLGIATVKGAFREFAGTLVIGEDLATATASGTVQVASVDTNEPQRDDHLRSADFFDADNHPEITFAARGAELRDGDTVHVIGQLTVRGISRPQNLTARLTGVAADALVLETEFTVDRDEFGLGWNQLGMLRGLTTVAATLRFTRATA
jgi:polyisoprenoid-binding protein YceI